MISSFVRSESRPWMIRINRVKFSRSRARQGRTRRRNKLGTSHGTPEPGRSQRIFHQPRALARRLRVFRLGFAKNNFALFLAHALFAKLLDGARALTRLDESRSTS